MSLRNHVRIVRVLAVGILIWTVAQAGVALWVGDWRFALAAVIGDLCFLALNVVLPLRTSNALACPSCGYSYGPRILLRMVCPHCGTPVPTDVRSSPGILVALILLAALGLGLVGYTWPMALPGLPDEEVSVVVMLDAEPLILEEEHYALPQHESKRYVLTPGSPEAEAVKEILSDYTYRRCGKTLRGDTSVSGLGEIQCYLNGPDFDVSFSGNRYVFLNGAVYQLGLVGDGAGAELTQRLWAVLEEATPQSTSNP